MLLEYLYILCQVSQHARASLALLRVGAIIEHSIPINNRTFAIICSVVFCEEILGV